MYATSVQHQGKPALPEIRATIATSKDEVTIRVSDHGNRHRIYDCYVLSTDVLMKVEG